MGTEGNRYVNVQVSFGEVHEPKVSGVSANKQKNVWFHCDSLQLCL